MHAQITVPRCLVKVTFAATLAAYTVAVPLGVHAQTSTRKISDNPRDAYLLLKSIVQDMSYDNDGQKDINNQINLDESLGCEPGSAVLGVTRGPLRIALVDLASDVIFIDMILAGYGFDPKLYSDRLSYFEQKQLDYIVQNKNNLGGARYNQNKLYRKFVQEVERRRRSQQPSLPRVYSEACGGNDYLEFIVATKPPNGQVRLIPRLFFTYCSRQKEDPTDFDHCDHWRGPFRENNKIHIIGRYKYVIQWGGRQTAPKDIDVDGYIHQNGEVIVFEE